MNKSSIKLDKGTNSKLYKVETICDSKVYVKELDNDHLLSLYYLVLWKDYSKEKYI